MAERKEELNNFLMRVKEENGKPALKLNIQKTKSMASGPITANRRIKKWKQWQIFIFLGSRITVDSDCSHEMNRCLLFGRKTMTNLDNVFKSRDITLPTEVCIVKAMVFPAAMYECESWTIKKAECWRIDAFRLWCWRRLLRVPWASGISNQ